MVGIHNWCCHLNSKGSYYANMKFLYSERGFRRIPDDGSIDKKSDVLWVHRSVKLRSTTCQDSSSEQCLMFWNFDPWLWRISTRESNCLPSSSEQCLMFWNLRPKSQEINESLPQCPIGRERMWQFHQSVKIYSNTFVLPCGACFVESKFEEAGRRQVIAC